MSTEDTTTDSNSAQSITIQTLTNELRALRTRVENLESENKMLKRRVEGDRTTIFAARPADADQGAIHRPYRPTCSPDIIRHPTVGCMEPFTQCRLGTLADLATQQTRLVVLELELKDSSPPTNRATEPRAMPVPNR